MHENSIILIFKSSSTKNFYNYNVILWLFATIIQLFPFALRAITLQPKNHYKSHSLLQIFHRIKLSFVISGRCDDYIRHMALQRFLLYLIECIKVRVLKIANFKKSSILSLMSSVEILISSFLGLHSVLCWQLLGKVPSPYAQ